MILSIAMLRARPGTRDAFQAHWRSVHAPLAARLPGLRGYIQNHIVADLPKATRRGAFKFDGLHWMWFDDIGAMQQAFASAQQMACTADLAPWVDEVRLVTAQAFEVLPCTQASGTLAKRVVLLERKPGLDQERFAVHWVQEHGPFILQYPQVLGYTQNLIVDASALIAGLPIVPAGNFGGVVELWCQDVATMNSVFEKSQTANGETKTNAQHGQLFIGTMTPYLAMEHVVIPRQRSAA